MALGDTTRESIEAGNKRVMDGLQSYYKSTDDNQADIKLRQQKLELQQQQQSFNQQLAIGGFVLATALVITVIIVLIAKTIRTRKNRA